MHVIFGGAFNGKRAYVDKLIHHQATQWINAEEEFPRLRPNIKVVVVFGVEKLFATKLDECLKKLEQWNHHAEVIVIATEIGRGIVPMDANMRKLRDDVGRFYQQLFNKATKVTRVWYGIAQTIKGDG